MKKPFKKTILLTLLTIFLFGLFIPFNQIFAQDANNLLVISANNSNFSPGTSIVITAKTYLLGAKLISFVTYPASGVFSPYPTCTTSGGFTDSIWSCSVGFKSSGGTFKISASTNYNGTLNSNEISIVSGVVCAPSQTPVNGVCTTPTPITPLNLNCTSPQVPNATKTACVEPGVKTYTPLAPLPGLEKDVPFETDPNKSPCPFGNYVNIMVKLIIGFSAVLAMVMIVIGGIEYMTSELISGKEAGRETLTNAILGLLIALGAYLILNTINPQLLNACLNNVKPAQITISPEQERTIINWSGGGNCVVVTDPNSNCNPSRLNPPFDSITNAIDPLFKANAAQASAICQLESNAVASTLSSLDKCSDEKAFSFGLFQINASAHRNEIPVCKDAFLIPAGDGKDQGNPLHEFDVTKDGKKYIARWSCTTVEPAYTTCKNYLLNPANNIAFAAQLYENQGWGPWTTYNSCRSKF